MPVSLNKAFTAYLIAFAVFALGIWLIIELGSIYLTAPRDLSGTWRARDTQSQSFAVDQSGKYLRFSFENGPKFDVVLQQSNPQSLTFNGEGWQVVATGPAASDALQFTFSGPNSQASVQSGTYRRERMDNNSTATPKPSAKQASISYFPLPFANLEALARQNSLTGNWK